MKHIRIQIDGRPYEVEVGTDDDGRFVKVQDHVFRLGSVAIAGDDIAVELEGEVLRVRRDGLDHVHVDDARHSVQVVDVEMAAGGGVVGSQGARIHPPMPGKIVSIRVEPGAEVAAGDVLLVLEAMKMQNEVTSPAHGVVREVHVASGQNVDAGDILVTIGPPDET